MTTGSTISRTFAAFAVAAILSLTATQLRAADPAPNTPASSVPVLSPAIQDAIKDISSDDFKVRKAASAKLQLALGEQLRDLVNSDDPEVLTRIDEILQDNDGLTRWMIDTLKLPADLRKSQIDFGLKPNVLPALVLTFSSEPQKRIDGIKALAKIDDPQAAALLAKFLDDPARPVYYAAMEAVWDKKPTDAIIESLWRRAMEENSSVPQTLPGRAADLSFRGQAVAGGITMPGGNFLVRQQDAEVAVDVLIHLQSTDVEKRITAFLQNYADSIDNTKAKPPAGGAGIGQAGGNLVSGGDPGKSHVNPMGGPMRNVFELIEACKPKDNIPVLYKLATTEIHQRNRGHGTDKWFWSNRTPPIAAVVIISGQKPADYGLKRAAVLGRDAWAFDSEAAEIDAMKKLREWYVANVDKNVPEITEQPPGAPLLPEPASQPANK